MKSKILILFYLFLLSTIVYCEGRPFTSSGEITFYIDYAGFKGVDEKTYQEFYLLSFADQFTSDQNDKDLNSHIQISTNIFDNFGKSIYANSWVTNVTIPQSEEGLNSLVIHDQWFVNLEPGEYNLHVELSDLLSKKSGSLTNKIIINAYDADSQKLQISDIEFVSSYEQTGNIQFKKGNFYIKPNPWRRYGVFNPILYYYFEIYNLNNINSDSIQIDYSIVNSDSKTIRKTSTSKTISGFSKTIFEGINVSTIKSGIYTLLVEVSQLGSLKKYYKSQPFEIIQPDYLELSNNSDLTFEISNNIAEYIMTATQFGVYNNLSDKLKIGYFEKFWKDNDPTPSTLENEYFQSVVSRYNYALKKLSWGNVEGWKSDRGRVVIKYGLPDDVNRNVFEESTLPYEIWSYQNEREFKFVFCDLRSDGRYTLLHSTKEDEINNPNWFVEVKK